jgi:hypothetical protein
LLDHCVNHIHAESLLRLALSICHVNSVDTSKELILPLHAEYKHNTLTAWVFILKTGNTGNHDKKTGSVKQIFDHNASAAGDIKNCIVTDHVKVDHELINNTTSVPGHVIQVIWDQLWLKIRNF